MDGQYVPITIEELPDGNLQGYCAALNLNLQWNSGALVWQDPATGRPIVTLEDERQALEDERQALEDTRQALEDTRQALEDTRQAFEDERQARAEAEAESHAERQAREDERQTRAQAEARVRELEQELRRLRDG